MQQNKFVRRILIVCYVLLLVELFCRAQHLLGIYDLNPKDDPSQISDTLNHVPGRRAGYDANGVQTHAGSKDANALTVLVMGDSFAQGPAPDESTPYFMFQEIESDSGPNVRVLNAGMGSYSPLIFIPQFDLLYPIYRPDKVVLMIDETDLADDYFRYRHLAVRENGRVIAVRRTPVHDLWFRLIQNTRRLPLYTLRALYKIWWHKWYLRNQTMLYHRRTIGMDQLLPLEFAKPDAPAETVTPMIEFFHLNSGDLIGLIASKVGPENLLVVRHPHLQHLTGEWQTRTGPVLEEEARRHGVAYRDLTPEFRSDCGPDYARCYIPEDMHFNEEGRRIYGKILAKLLLKSGFLES